ncbi:MAG TPA: TIGR01777 family oxidoreductase [Terriglobia bacterium]|nr:TIGR01777 family oxidoreductase [Terriglobia bacterium]
MKVLVTGSSGLIGSALVPILSAEGHQVTRLVRPNTRPGPEQLVWDPAAGRLEAAGIEGFDAVAHLSGENVASRRWTAEQKKRLFESRVKSTQLLAGTLARLSHPPRTLVCASGVGYYGDRGDELLTEDSASGSNFPSRMCREWEEAAELATRNIRVVNLRIGAVLSAAGGALALMLPPFKAGLGGTLGSGRQYMSWIAIDDVTGVIQHVLSNESVSGPVNTVAPQPVTNREFTKTLGRVLGRPTFLTVPSFVLRLAVGEMAEALLLASQRVIPARLQSSGYTFRYPELEGALRHLLGKAA